MEQPNIFREFSEKVQTILASPDRQVVLDALKELAEGRAAKLQDGTEIEALSGLGNQPQQGQDPPELYTQTMTALLRWAVKAFPNHSRWIINIFPGRGADEPNEPNMWETMALLDGPKGYNQRLIGEGLYRDDGAYVARCDSGFIPIVPVPEVILPSQPRPIQPLDDDLPYIPDFLHGNSTARAVVATRCEFGWPRLSLDCLCLYVDADDTISLENSIASLTELIIIMEAKLCHTTNALLEAQKLLAPTGLSASEISEHRLQLRTNPTPRIPQPNNHVYHGQSISLIGEASKGSIGVFLSPCDVEGPKVYALTAYHAVPFKTANERRVMTPGRFDFLTQLYRVVRPVPKTHEEIESVLNQQHEACGHVEYGDIGSTQEGWRSDFALIHLSDHLLAENGQWYDDEMQDRYKQIKGSYFPGTCGIVGSVDPQAGQIVYKDGATTGCTAGRIFSSEAVLFEPGTAIIAEESAPDVVRTKLLSFRKLRRPTSEGHVCAPGDSGSGVFIPAPEEDGWKWAGQLVMVWQKPRPKEDIEGIETGEIEYMGLMIPQSQVLKGLKEKTGMAWRMSG